MRRVMRTCLTLLVLGTLAFATVGTATPAALTNPSFQRTWARTDKPVADLQVSRTWMWGPEPFTEASMEAYEESPNGQRLVQYFDKSRMEITHPDNVDDGVWYVTNGLLVVEMVDGRVQIGDLTFEQRQPAQVGVAGDADDTSGPTYATMGVVRNEPALPDGATVTARLARSGQVTDDQSLAAYGVTVVQRVTVPGIDHQIAAPFWNFMNAAGQVWENGALTQAQLFVNPYYATGLPITEPYWATVKVANTAMDVLLQCFERRCLTYTPSNPAGWQVEAGNVGQHYYAWRHDGNPPPPPDGPWPDEGAVLYESSLLDWPAVQTAYGSGVAEADGYHVRVVPYTGGVYPWVSALAPGITVADASVSVDVRMAVTDSWSYACVVTRAQQDVAYYELCLDDQGFLSLWYDVVGQEPEPVLIEDVSDAVTLTSWNNLKLVTAGAELHVVLNNQYYGVVEQAGLALGGAGIIVISIDDREGTTATDWVFRNLVIRSLAE